MSWLCSSSELVSGGWLSSKYAGLGIPGSAIPGDGDNGGSPVLNDNISLTSEYYWRLVTPPDSGTLTLNEDLSYLFAGASDGTHPWEYGLFEDGLSQGTAIVNDTFGVVTSTVSSDSLTTYAVRQFAQSGIRCDYLIRSNISNDLQAVFDILNGSSVSSGNTVTYSIFNTLIVGASNTASYSIVSPLMVGASNTATYVINSDVPAKQAYTFIKHAGKYVKL